MAKREQVFELHIPNGLNFSTTVKFYRDLELPIFYAEWNEDDRRYQSSVLLPTKGEEKKP